MSTHWFPLGLFKLKPAPRIACLNLLLVFALACATLLLGTPAVRSVPSRDHGGLLHVKSACMQPRQAARHHRARGGRSESEQSDAAVLRYAVTRAKRRAEHCIKPTT